MARSRSSHPSRTRCEPSARSRQRWKFAATPRFDGVPLVDDPVVALGVDPLTQVVDVRPVLHHAEAPVRVGLAEHAPHRLLQPSRMAVVGDDELDGGAAGHFSHAAGEAGRAGTSGEALRNASSRVSCAIRSS